VKRIAETLGVARSNLVERRLASVRSLVPRPGDAELTADIRRLVDTRPSYGYRRIAALLKRERRAAGHDSVNAKRVYRLIKNSCEPDPVHNALLKIDQWMEDYNSEHPHSRLGYRSPREYPAECPV
jgi:transposase InsO family protein